MLRRTFFAVAAITATLRRRLRGQNRGELQAMADKQLEETPFKSAPVMERGTAELVAVLEDPDAGEFAQAKACQRLATVGGDSAVPALAGLLGDPRLSHYARTALEPMPGAAAARALREALASVQGALLVGMVNSIGVRRDREALDALAGLRHGDDPDVAAAASWAIGRIRRP